MSIQHKSSNKPKYRRGKKDKNYLVLYIDILGGRLPKTSDFYLDIDYINHLMLLTAYFSVTPSEIELDLLDDIATNSNAPIPDFFIEAKVELIENHKENERHDY